jgi:hypothetical protein
MIFTLVFASLGCDAPRSSQAPVQDPRYVDTSLAAVAESPRHFDQFHLRVRGVCQLQFEGNTLWVSSESRSAGRLDQAFWLDVGWPVSDTLAAFNGHEVLVETRFDANRTGHMGCCRGTLTDIRAIWRPGFETAAVILRHETRADALDQLEFKTGWVYLGHLEGTGHWYGVPSFQLYLAANPSARPSSQALPERGDYIRLTERSRIHILDYATAGEQRRLEPLFFRGLPAQADETRLWLPAGVVVRVEDVNVRPPVGERRVVSARVADSPSTDRVP